MGRRSRKETAGPCPDPLFQGVQSNGTYPQNPEFGNTVFRPRKVGPMAGVDMRRQASGQPDPVDIHVGGRIRLRRTLLGMSQEKLANALGLTFQQVQKYERGANRIGSSRLYQLSRILDVPVAYFFDDMAPDISGPARGLGDQSSFDQEHLATRETLELARAYYRIGNRDVRQRIFDMVKATADLDERMTA